MTTHHLFAAIPLSGSDELGPRVPYHAGIRSDPDCFREILRKAMSQKNVEIVRRHLEAWNQRDKAAYVASFGPGAEIDWSRARALYKGVYRGPEQLEAFWGRFGLTFEDSQLGDTRPHGGGV